MLISKALDNHRQNPRAGGGGGGTGRGTARARRWVPPSLLWTDARAGLRPGPALHPVPWKSVGSTSRPGGGRGLQAARVAVAAPDRASAARGERRRPQPRPHSRLGRGREAAGATSAPGARPAASRGRLRARPRAPPRGRWVLVGTERPDSSPHPLWPPPHSSSRASRRLRRPFPLPRPRLPFPPSPPSRDPFPGPPWPRP